ncbi:MarR family winged helix-turn-helix transcriptional regulator [Sphingomonas profundi]|uniref:MarR family winged helix-turn-helix transcriptional regulator n=1 Tax=Alterirhizorhabdus profundi TaxID=2681549 RepID=UPI0012E916C6|nr:MarR family winged helix-turn-helix transcriptional regulator [Sphingomonas profundi]
MSRQSPWGEGGQDLAVPRRGEESAVNMANLRKPPADGAFREPHDYKTASSALDPLFRREIDYLIRMIRMREIYAVELMLAPIGLSLSAWYPLTVLQLEDGMSQRELGLRLNLKDAAIGKALDALERAGLVIRKKDKTDRRKALVFLTSKGKTASKQVAKMRAKFQAVAVGGFSEAEKEQFRDMLEKSYYNIEDFVSTFETSVDPGSD